MGLLGKLFNHEDKKETAAAMPTAGSAKVLSIDGMMCQHCVAHVTKALQAIDGVNDVKVDLDKKSASLTAADNVSDDTLKKAVADAGYTVTNIAAPTAAAGTKKTLSIDGMMCQHCVAHVTKALQAINGVSDVKVDLDKKSAVLNADGSVTDDALKTAVADAGYTVTAIK